MFYRKKIDSTMVWLKDKNKIKNKENNSDLYDVDCEEDIDLEKGDKLAMFLSAILVFSPIFIVLIGILIWISNY